MEFKEAMRIYSRICGGKELCDGCVLEHNCIVWDACDYGEAESILAKWAAEHPEKTIADDFFEKHPRAKKGTGGFPSVCAAACISRSSRVSLLIIVSMFSLHISP